jgi:tol-pal system protein YbgF
VALYNEAYRKFTAGDVDGAIEGFRSLVDLFPDSDLADNSLFWIGESHVQKNRLAEAEKAFAETVSRFPNGNKVPDALFKLGYTQSMLNKQDQATTTWRDLISRFPNEPAALKAKQELQDLGR